MNVNEERMKVFLSSFSRTCECHQCPLEFTRCRCAARVGADNPIPCEKALLDWLKGKELKQV